LGELLFEPKMLTRYINTDAQSRSADATTS